MSSPNNSSLSVSSSYELSWSLGANRSIYHGYRNPPPPHHRMQGDAWHLAEARPVKAPSPSESAPASPGEVHSDAEALVARQRAIVNTYPNEYVVLLGDRLIAHTPDKEEAFSRFDAAWDESEDLEPIVVPPAERRGLPGPVLRGRSLPNMAKGSAR